MVIVVFTGRSTTTVEAEAEPGESLIDLVDRLGAPVELACRSANCASCLVRVDEGAAALSPPRRDEQAVLSLLEAPETARLACQAVVHAHDGRVVLHVLGRPSNARAAAP